MVPVCFNKFFRLPICLGKDSLIVNTGRNSVSSIQFHSHKLLQSWVLKQPHSFSCPVVYNDRENVLLSVMDKNVLMIWDYEADNLEKAQKVKFQEEVFAVVSVPNQIIVVFNSGSCLLLEDAIAKHEFLTKSCIKNEEKLLWVDASPCESDFSIFLLTHTHSSGHNLHSLLLSTSDGKINKHNEQIISRDSVSLQSWCIKSEDTYASFLTIWSDGQVHSYSGDCESSVHLLTVPRTEEKELLAMEALDICHIVIVSSSPSSGGSYELWDTRYSTKKTCKSIDSTLSQNLQARILGGTLFLPSDQCIVAEQLKVASSTLAAVVGKSSNKSDVQKGLLYSWTSDGIVHEESAEEEGSDDISASTLSTITNNESFQELLGRLHKEEDAKKISSYLQEIKLISELKLVRLLQHLLREFHPEFSEEAHTKRKSSRRCETQIAGFFLELFCIPYNDIFLQQHLRKLSFKETLVTLKILSLLLGEHKLHTKHGHQWGLLFIRIISWICLLLSSHIEEFMLSAQNEAPIVQYIFNTTCTKLSKYSQVKQLVPYHQKKLHFENSDSTDYCIEILHL